MIQPRRQNDRCAGDRIIDRGLDGRVDTDGVGPRGVAILRRNQLVQVGFAKRKARRRDGVFANDAFPDRFRKVVVCPPGGARCELR